MRGTGRCLGQRAEGKGQKLLSNNASAGGECTNEANASETAAGHETRAKQVKSFLS